MALKSLLKKIQCMVLKMIEVIMKSKMTLLTYGGGGGGGGIVCRCNI